MGDTEASTKSIQSNPWIASTEKSPHCLFLITERRRETEVWEVRKKSIWICRRRRLDDLGPCRLNGAGAGMFTGCLLINGIDYTLNPQATRNPNHFWLAFYLDRCPLLFFPVIALVLSSSSSNKLTRFCPMLSKRNWLVMTYESELLSNKREKEKKMVIGAGRMLGRPMIMMLVVGGHG